MTDLQSLIDGFKAATDPSPTTAVTSASIAAALGTDPSMQFVYADDLTVPAGGFGAIYAFGDSLSDAGNIATATLGVLPVNSVYSDGRFTNGNVWVQDLATNLGLPIPKASLLGGTDYAYGGAETGPTPVHTVNPTDLPSQLGQFVANVPSPPPNALYTVWAGSNDVLDIANSTETPAQQLASVQQAVNNEAGFIGGLVAHGAKNLVVMGVPDLGATPYEQARPASDATSSTLAQAYNADLGAALQQIMASGAAEVDYINTYAMLDAAVANPSAYGLTNVTQPVWNGNLTDANSGTLAATGSAQNGHLFFDGLHPTAAGHTLLADGVTQSLTGTA
jgi:phospholipase/lecithinase/hemolysin